VKLLTRPVLLREGVDGEGRAERRGWWEAHHEQYSNDLLLLLWVRKGRQVLQTAFSGRVSTLAVSLILFSGPRDFSDNPEKALRRFSTRDLYSEFDSNQG